MSRVAYSASVGKFYADCDSNRFIPLMKKGALENRIGTRTNEVRSWEMNALKISSLLHQAQTPTDAYIAFEYKSPVSGRVDCMLFAVGRDGKKHIVHIELKQWGNDSVLEYGDGAFKVIAQVGAKGHQEVTAHPSQQALNYQINIKNYISVATAPDAVLEGCAYCYNYYREEIPHDLYSPTYNPVMKICPLHGGDEVGKFAADLQEILAGGNGYEIFKEFVNCQPHPTKNLMDVTVDIFKGGNGFVLQAEQIASANMITAMANKALKNPDKKFVLIVKGGPGTGKTVIALQILAALANSHKDLMKFFTTRSSALRDTLIDKLKKISVLGETSAADLIGDIYSFRPSNYKENEVGILLVDEAHRVCNKANNYFVPDIRNNRTFLPQILSLIYCSRVSVFFIDDKQGVKKSEIGTSAKIFDYAAHYSQKIRDSISGYRLQLGKDKERLAKIRRELAELVGNRDSLPKNEFRTRYQKLKKREAKAVEEVRFEYQLDHVRSAVEEVDVETIELKTQFRCNGSDNYLDCDFHSSADQCHSARRVPLHGHQEALRKESNYEHKDDQENRATGAETDSQI